MNYKEITTESFGIKQNHIVVDNGDYFTSFPADNNNPTYLAFLAALEKENPTDPHFVAWVEAGNDPEDFWERDELLIRSGEEGITVDIEEL